MHLAVEALSVVFRSREGASVPALGPVTIHIAEGQFVALLGPSGSGKSTLIRVLAGLQQPTSGSVWLGQQRLDGFHARVSMMFQEAALLPWRTVLDNVALPLELAGMPRRERRKQAADMLARMGLSEFARAYPAALSGGMAQRVALGRTLIQAPRVLLLDEPFGSLDAMTREGISMDVHRIWHEQRPTVLMVTHDINEAILMAERVLVFSPRPGRIAADLPVMLPQPRHPAMLYTAEFAALAHRARQVVMEGWRPAGSADVAT